MSRRNVRFLAFQQSFFDKSLCKTLFNTQSVHEGSERPSKRQRITPDPSDWVPILEVAFDCELVNPPFTDTTSFNIPEQSEMLEVTAEFDEFVFSVYECRQQKPLLAYVVPESERDLLTHLHWAQKLEAKNGHCMRSDTTLSLLALGSALTSAQLKFRLEIRFDYHLLHSPKLLLRDRITVFDRFLEFSSSEVNAEQFYSNISGPLKNSLPQNPECVQHPSLTCKLFPFQARAVAWMLQREKVELNSALGLSNVNCAKSTLPPLWCSMKDLDDQVIYLNRHQGYMTRSLEWIWKEFPEPEINGGILAEVRCLVYVNY